MATKPITLSPYLKPILESLVLALAYDLAIHDLAPKPTDGVDCLETRDRYLQSAYLYVNRIPFRGDI